MRILEAQVKDTFDETQSGGFFVECESLGEGKHYVNYVTPYQSYVDGGFIGIPDTNSLVLITQPDNSNSWYYLGSIVKPYEKRDTESRRLDAIQSPLPDKGVYAARGYPQKIKLVDPDGNAVSLSHLYNPEYFNSKAELKSGLGKKVSLVDSPKVSSIIIRNEHGDGIKVTTDPTIISAANSIEVECRGPQKYICRESQIDLLVEDGREINITNKSTGFNSNPAVPNEYGNINLKSSYNDINLTVEEGRVFVTSKNGNLIQVASSGEVVIYAEGGVKVFSNNSLEFQATKDVHIESVGGDVVLAANAGSVICKGSNGVYLDGESGTVALDGSNIHFNSGIAPTQTAGIQNLNIEKEKNNYGD